jgi:hypothetical protein
VRPSSEPRGTRFRVRGSPVIYAAVVTGWVWMTSWQAAQTTRVLRRLVAMSAAHGVGLTRFPRLASLRTWCTSTLPGSPHSSHRRVRSPVDQLLAGVGGRFRDTVGEDRVLVAYQGIPPNRATRSGLPLRWTLASKQVRSPCRVSILAWCLGPSWTRWSGAWRVGWAAQRGPGFMWMNRAFSGQPPSKLSVRLLPH